MELNFTETGIRSIEVETNLAEQIKNVVKSKDINAISEFIKRECTNPEFETQIKSSVLLAAIDTRDKKLIKKILDLNIEVNRCGLRYTEFYDRPIVYSIGTNDVKIFKMVLEAMGEFKDRFLNVEAFSRAVKESAFQIAEYLLKTYPEKDYINEQKILGESHLMSAVSDDDYKMVKFLIDRGANVNQISNETSVLCRCCDNIRIAKLLLENGADPNEGSRDGNISPLSEAAAYGKPELIKLYLQYGAEINKRDSYGSTALMTAVGFGRLDNVKCLLENGADPNIKTSSGETVLHYAFVCSKADDPEGEKIYKILHMLVHDYHVEPVYDTLFLWKFMECNSTISFKFFREHGFDLNSSLINGENIIHSLVRRGYITDAEEDLIEKATSFGIDLNHKNNYGETPLHVAAKYDSGKGSRFNYLKVLLKNGADTTIKDNKGRTPYDVAKFYGCKQNMELLEEASV